jgi:hypothetical protein
MTDTKQSANPASASSETLREAFMRHISNHPQFREAKKSGKAFVIVGAPMTKKLHAYSPTLTTRVVLQQLWDDERQIVELMARLRGLTPEQFSVQDVNLILAEARHTGELAERYVDEADEGTC